MNHLVPHHAFGAKGALKDSVHFYDESTYLYVAGHNVVISSPDQKQQRLLQGSNDTCGVTAIAMSPTKRLLAIAEGALLLTATPTGAGAGAGVGFGAAALTLSSDSRSSLNNDYTAAKPSGGSQAHAAADNRSVDTESRDSDQQRVGGQTTTTGPTPAPGGGASVDTKITGALISLWETGNWKKRKVLSLTEALGGIREYVSISFSADGRNIAAQGCGPDWTLVLWSLEKSKVFATVKSSGPHAEVYQVQYCLTDASLISVLGNGFAKTFKLTETAFRQIATDISKLEGKKFLWHMWLPETGEHAGKDNCIYSLDSGELIHVVGGEIVATLMHPGSMPDGSINAAEVIIMYSKGFICGEKGGIVSVYDKVDEKEAKEGFKKVCSVKVEKSGARVCGLALSVNEEILVCVLENNQVVTLPFQQKDFFKPQDIPKELVSQSYHVGSITGMDICLRKPIIITCGADKSVRVWNYLERSCEIVKFFAEDSFSVSLHPSGFYALIGFSDKLRFMNILMDDIRPAKEIGIKSCQECSFSNGGQYFAASHNNIVQIFSTYSCENLGNMRGHSGKVRCIWWSSDDATILSAGVDGAIYEWKVKDYKRNRENVLKGCVYTSVVGVTNSNSIVAVGSDKRLKELDETQIIKSFASTAVLTHIALPDGSRLLFAGTEFGAVRSYRYPLTGEFQEVQASSGSISRLCTSWDANLLFVAGEDGVLSIFDIKDREKALVAGAMRREKEVLGWADEVLITKTDLEEIWAHVQDLEEKVAELRTDNDYQMRLKDLSLNEKIKSLSDNFQHQIEEAQLRYDRLQQAKNQEKSDMEEKQSLLEERHLQQLKDLEEQWQQKMMVEVQRYSTLCHERDMLNIHWEEQTAMLIASHKQTIHDITEEFESKIDEEHQAYERVQREMEQIKQDFEEIKRQTEEDTDQEIEELKQRYDGRLAQESDTILRLKGENGLLKKKFSEFQKDIEEQKAEIKQLYEQKKDLYSTLGLFEREVGSLKKDLSERDETIGEKENRIYELKRKNQELEKVKFVLEYKIKDLKRTIEPREVELQNIRAQIANMEKELERAHNGNTRKELTVADLMLKLNGLQKEEEKLRMETHKYSTLIKCFQHDFHQLTQIIQDPQSLKETVKALNEKYGREVKRSLPLEKDLQKEMTRQRDYLERNVTGLQRKFSLEREGHRKTYLRIMQENVMLIKELNELRREIKVMRLSSHPPTSSNHIPIIPPHNKEVAVKDSQIEHVLMQLEAKEAELLKLRKLFAQNEADSWISTDIIVNQERATLEDSKESTYVTIRMDVRVKGNEDGVDALIPIPTIKPNEDGNPTQ